MQQSGEYVIPAPRETVWQALNDPEVLSACVPGCQSMEQVDDTHFNAAVKAKVGPVSAMFQAELELSDLKPPESYTIIGQVKGGAAGFGKGDAKVSLSEEGDGTRLAYTVDAKVGGKLAQVGSRLVDGAARKMADDFFGAFSERLGGHGEPEASDESETDEPRYETSDNWKIWVIAFLVFGAAMLLAL